MLSSYGDRRIRVNSQKLYSINQSVLSSYDFKGVTKWQRAWNSLAP
ncbi:hypothetical protein IQ268_08860 [Oculatella sp. LEGE 06141]|nr:hypothetical protein [Oculatella sp. LEGE 06141]MBE9178668.1 hypothetical protein [Oculatella sp. LEGE 06141]